jgi:nucleoside-diphosphate-sugar epimerase
MRKILVTGAAGFIPSSLVDKLIEDNQNIVVGIDNFLTGTPVNLPSANNGNFTFVKGDVNRYEDLAAVMMSNRFDVVFHYSAVVGVKRTLENPLRVLSDIKGIQAVLELSKNTGVKRVFFSSSSEVYGEPVELPQRELTTPLNSKLPYAVVKNIGESFLKSYNYEHSLNYTIFRFFNTFGPKQSHDFVVSKFILSALKGEDIALYGDGLQTRTFCYIDDNIEATIKCLNDDWFVNEVVNFGSDKEITIKTLAETVIRLTKSPSKIIYLPALPEGDMRRRCPDNTKMRELLNHELLSLEMGIQKILDGMLGNRL